MAKHENVPLVSYSEALCPPLRDFFVKPSLINISQKYVSTPQMLGTNIRVELNILGFTHILELVPPPPNVLHGNQDWMMYIGLSIHPRNRFLSNPHYNS